MSMQQYILTHITRFANSSELFLVGHTGSGGPDFDETSWAEVGDVVRERAISFLRLTLLW